MNYCKFIIIYLTSCPARMKFDPIIHRTCINLFFFFFQNYNTDDFSIGRKLVFQSDNDNFLKRILINHPHRGASNSTIKM